jgi:hypothetical protein
MATTIALSALEVVAALVKAPKVPVGRIDIYGNYF